MRDRKKEIVVRKNPSRLSVVSHMKIEGGKERGRRGGGCPSSAPAFFFAIDSELVVSSYNAFLQLINKYTEERFQTFKHFLY